MLSSLSPFFPVCYFRRLDSLPAQPPSSLPSGKNFSGIPLETEDATSSPLSFSSTAERWQLGVCFAVLAILKIAYVFVYRVDTDEPQHLHVVWGWTQGLLPYRDFFDNHSPLFQALFSPLMRLLGERPDILIPMRLAMVPLFAVSLWAVYEIGASLFSRRAGVWAAVFAGLWPNFLLTMTEFRTDDGWATLWLVALALLLREPLTMRRLFAAGLIFGTAFAVSMKTTLMVLALALALLTVLAIRLLARDRVDWAQFGRWFGVWLAGLVIVPAAVMCFFYANGALYKQGDVHNLYYCVIEHNALPGLGKWHQHWFHKTWFPISVPVLFFLARKYIGNHHDSTLAVRRALLFLTAAFYYYPMRSFWPLITRQDFLPLSPLICLGIAFVVLKAADRLLAEMPSMRRLWMALPALVALAEVVLIFMVQLPWVNKAADFERWLGLALRITNPTDMVMDSKGETIFRKRPYYFVLEGVTNERIKQGLIADDIAEKLIATKTCVATTGRMPEMARAFILENYLNFSGGLYVAGKDFGIVHSRRHFEFDVKIPARYAISTTGNLNGVLDGKPYDGPRFMDAGPHEFETVAGKGNLTLIWAQAFERGYGPYTPVSANQKTQEE